jgi:zinc-finger of a C2HC-type
MGGSMNAGKMGGNPSGGSPDKMVSRPKALTCYICGREFGTSSLEIHLKSCKKKWELEEEKKPKKDRRPVPSAPTNFDEMLTGK